jgi:hypothetical protein
MSSQDPYEGLPPVSPELREHMARAVSEFRVSSAPIDHDVRQQGIALQGSFHDLWQKPDDREKALPVFADHLQREGYITRVRSAMEDASISDSLANALGAIARPEHLPDLFDLLGRQDRRSRVLLFPAVFRVGGNEGREFVEGLRDHPYLGPEATAQLNKRRARNTAPKRFQTALDKRGPVPDRTDDVEWSTSVDADDLPRLARHLSRTLGGDFSSAVGKALFAVIASAPDDGEDSVVLATSHGVVEFGWFIGDPSTYDLSLHGTDAATAAFSSFFLDA